MEIELEHEVDSVGLKVEEGLSTLLCLVVILVIRSRTGVISSGAVYKNVTRAKVVIYFFFYSNYFFKR